VEFMSLLMDSVVAITDSGGVQEETCYLGIPCLTVRESTERPITISSGTNRLVKMSEVAQVAAGVLGKSKSPAGSQMTVPEYWDGKTAGRVVTSLRKTLGV